MRQVCELLLGALISSGIYKLPHKVIQELRSELDEVQRMNKQNAE